MLFLGASGTKALEVANSPTILTMPLSNQAPSAPLRVVIVTPSPDSSFGGSRVGTTIPNKGLAFTETTSPGIKLITLLSF